MRGIETDGAARQAERRFHPGFPLFILLVSAVACAILLALPLTLPIGPMYWDLVVYLDGAHRVLSGQTPSVDFFAPVGPLGYWLLAAGQSVFSQAQPLLLAQWSLLPVTAPLMALVLWEVGRRSQASALALLVPFLAFQLMPMNVEQYSTFPSTDGYGIYNRQVSILLYVLTAALVFCRSQRILLAVVLTSCLSLFLLKITGFLSAGLLCAFAFAAGRVRLVTALLAAGGFLVALAVLELAGGIVSAYLGDILTLVTMNEGVLASRFLQAASIHFGIFGSGSLLALALLVLDRGPVLASLLGTVSHPSLTGITALLDHHALWLGIALLAGLFFETQNTGGQAFIFIWPVLLAILLDAGRLPARGTILVFALVAATTMPPFVNTLHRFSRAMIGQIQYVALDHRHLGTLGAVSQRPEVMERARKVAEVYAEFPETYRALAEREVLPTFSLYSDLDFQTGWLMAVDEAASAILAYEAENGVRFETIMNLNFANPFPAILGREGTRHIAIGADPFRAVPAPSERALAAVAATDLVLYPLCPITTANEALRAIYGPALAGREEVRLSPCWLGYLRR